MKGINTAARIAAIGATALFLGSSAIAAGVMYGNLELVNPNGQPTAKIVVGSSAAISDGVAAANIASILASHAYKSSTLTAAVQGAATCSASGTVSSTGKCDVSDEKVTITIELPGVLGNAYQFKTLITDTLDKTLANRMATLSEDLYNGSTTVSDTSSILSPLRGSGQSQGATGDRLTRIGQNEFTGFQQAALKDQQATSDFSYNAEQGFWVGTSSSPSSGVYYDSNNQYRNIVAKPTNLVYNVRFLGNDYGIPVCTANLATSNDWTSCTSDTDKTDNHRVKIKFMGSDWVISKLQAPSNATAAGQNFGTVNVTGGVSTLGDYIKLAKEAKYDIINVGGEIDGGTFKIRLADISVATGSTNAHPAILDVLDANGAVVGQIQVLPGDTYTYTQSSTGQSIKVHVYRTAPGFTLNAKWAEIAIYTDEIKLSDGKRYNEASSTDPNWGNVWVSLLWKNRDGSSTDSQPDSLRELTIYVDDVSSYLGGDNRMKPTDSVNFPKKDAVYKLTYNGLDLTDADYSSIYVSSDAGRSLTIGTTSSNDCNTKKSQWTSNLIKVHSDQTGAFGGTNDPMANDRVNEFYLDPIGGYDNTSATDQSVTTTASTWAPQIYWKPAGCSYYKVQNLKASATNINGSDFNSTVLTSFTTSGDSTGAGAAVKFEAAGADSSAPGSLRWYFNNSALRTSRAGYTADLTTAPIGEIVVQEDAGKHNATSHYPVMIRFPVYNLSGTNDWNFKTADSATSVVYYNGVNVTDTNTAITVIQNATSYEMPLYTERGSKVTGVSLTGVNYRQASKIGQPSFTFSATGNDVSSTGSDWVAKVGDSKTLADGAKLTVKDITQTVGSCVAGTSGGAPSCTVAMGGVSARIMPDNVASVQAVQPYDIKGSNLVMTDKDAAGVGGVVITVGGPAVNSVTADVVKDANVDWKTNSVVVKAFGSKVVVAGASAADTMQAAQEFINSLQSS